MDRLPCCVPYCGNAGVLPLPKKLRARMNWQIALREHDCRPNGDSLLCDEHFKPTDFIIKEAVANNGLRLTTKILKKGVIPTVFVKDGQVLKKQRKQCLKPSPPNQITIPIYNNAREKPRILLRKNTTQSNDRVDVASENRSLPKLVPKPEPTIFSQTNTNAIIRQPDRKNKFNTNQPQPSNSRHEPESIITPVKSIQQIKVETNKTNVTKRITEISENNEVPGLLMEVEEEDNGPDIEYLDMSYFESQDTVELSPKKQTNNARAHPNRNSTQTTSSNAKLPANMNQSNTSQKVNLPRQNTPANISQNKGKTLNTTLSDTSSPINITTINMRVPFNLLKNTQVPIVKTQNSSVLGDTKVLAIKNENSAKPTLVIETTLKKPVNMIAIDVKPSPTGNTNRLRTYSKKNLYQTVQKNLAAISGRVSKMHVQPSQVHLTQPTRAAETTVVPNKNSQHRQAQTQPTVSYTTMKQTSDYRNTTPSTPVVSKPPMLPTRENVTQANNTISDLNDLNRAKDTTLLVNEHAKKTERDLRVQLRKLKKKLNQMKRSQQLRKQKVAKLKNLNAHSEFLKYFDKLEPDVQNLTKLHLRVGKLSAHARRFTDEEKNFSRKLYEKNPEAYQFMRKIGFVLPVVSKLKPPMTVPFGNNADAVVKLKERIGKLKPMQRLCTLMFDEQVLKPWNRKYKITTTLEDGQENVVLEADHTLLFMVRSIMSKYKEPVSYTYSYGSTSSTNLATHIKNVVSDLHDLGLTIVATVCAHTDVNRQALQMLTNEARNECLIAGRELNENIFFVNNKPIIVIYDAPHLIRGIRNHLMTKDLSYVSNGRSKVGKWCYLQMALNENIEINGERPIPKLTETLVNPPEDKLSETKYAAQVFSQTVGSYIGYLADKGILAPESQDTADLLLFFDQLFDSVNAYFGSRNRSKKRLQYGCRIKSCHHIKWAESIEVLESMTFLDHGSPVQVPDIECWIWTLRSMQLVMKRLHHEYKVPKVWPRNLNQEYLERMFRSYINPEKHTKVNYSILFKNTCA